MFKRRGSFKVAPGVRANWGRGGLTSVNVGGVRLGGARRSGGRRPGPTKAEVLAEHWRLRPGIHYVRIEAPDGEGINLVVDGGQLTYRRLCRIRDGLYDANADAVAHAFKTFVKRWDITEDDGSTPLSISKRGVERLGINMIFGLTVEIANALKIPKKDLGYVLHDSSTGKPLRVSVSNYAPLEVASVSVPQVTAPGALGRAYPMSPAVSKSKGVAYLLWLLLGLIGGHRYYLGRYGSAFLMTITLGGLGVWWLVDLFLIPGMIRDTTERS